MQKNVKLILFALIFEFPLLIILIVASGDNNNISNLVIGNSIIDIVYFYLISPLIMIGIILFFSVLLTQLFFRLHKIMKLNRYDYGILKNFNEDIKFSGMLMRAVILGLFAFSMGLYMTQVLDPELILSTTTGATNLVYVLIATLFILPFLIIVVLPVWLLKDTGIMSSRKTKKEGSRQLPDVEGVYRDFHSIIKGYVGISTIFAMALLIWENFINELNPTDWQLGLILMIFTPFHSVALCIPALLFYEWRLEKNKAALIKKLEKKNIKFVENISEL